MTERATAKRLADSAAGAALENDIAKNHSFEPEDATSVFTAEQKEQIRELLANATSIQQVEEIENSVKRGILPEQLQDQPPSKRQKLNT